jgi:nucleotide-binding universal stress UspA family protein
MKFLVGYNGSVEAAAALELACQYADVFEASIVVVSSSGGVFGEKQSDIEKAQENLAAAQQILLKAGVVYECNQLARGVSPGEDLVRFAAEEDIDQIFVGIEKRSRTQKLLLGSTAQYIILNAPCPVVTVK